MKIKIFLITLLFLYLLLTQIYIVGSNNLNNENNVDYSSVYIKEKYIVAISEDQKSIFLRISNYTMNKTNNNLIISFSEAYRNENISLITEDEKEKSLITDDNGKIIINNISSDYYWIIIEDNNQEIELSMIYISPTNDISFGLPPEDNLSKKGNNNIDFNFIRIIILMTIFILLILLIIIYLIKKEKLKKKQ